MRLRAPNGPELLQGILAMIVVGAASWIIATSPDDLPRRGGTLDVLQGGEPVQIKVEAGDGAGKIGDRLQQSGIIDNAASFQRLAKISGSETGLAAGEYEFLPGTSVLDALVRIRSGLTAVRVISIPEGLRIEEVASILERRGVMKGSDFLLAASVFNGGQGVDPLLIGARQPGASLEGYLYPATYSFGRSVRPEDVVLTMVKALSDRFTPALRQEAQSKGLSVADVLILASIVEREAWRSEDKPLIASVFLNRMKLQMPLQADPTVQYALVPPGGAPKTGSFWKPDLSADDLKLNSPYNTYVKPGLPPSPIASPSLESIMAVIRPANTKYLYFLAKPSDGSLVLAESFEEHERNVARYLR
jgi:uncharacterized YceG family protein